MRSQENSIARFVLFSCIIASLGALLFGLNMGLTNGALSSIAQDFSLSVAQSGKFNAIMLYGCVCGALLGGVISNIIGRKGSLVVMAFGFLFFLIVSVLSDTISLLFYYRFVIGFFVGLASFVVPLYLSEVAPTNHRGSYLALFQMMVSLGYFIIYLTNFIIDESGGDWRLMFLPVIIASFIMTITVFFIPRSPRWLLLKKKNDNARKVLEKIRCSSVEIEGELSAMEHLSIEKKTIGQLLLTRPYLKVLMLALSLQLFQQLTGVNTIMFYSTIIFEQAHFEDAGLVTVILGAVSLLSNLIAMRYVDLLGKKKMMYLGLSVIVISLLLIAVLFHLTPNLPDHELLSQVHPYMIAFFILVFIVAYAMSSGPITWSLCAEIFPLKGRDFGVTISTVVNWVSAALVVQFSLSFMKDANGAPNFVATADLFLFFAIFSTIAIVVIRYFCPETKGISLEAMEENLMNGMKLKDIGSLYE